MAKTPAERQQEKRERDKMTEIEREDRLLSRQIITKLYHNDDIRLRRLMSRPKITEEQDGVSPLIWAADRMSDVQLKGYICNP